MRAFCDASGDFHKEKTAPPNIHLKDRVTLYTCHTTIRIPLHWISQVKTD